MMPRDVQRALGTMSFTDEAREQDVEILGALDTGAIDHGTIVGRIVGIVGAGGPGGLGVYVVNKVCGRKGVVDMVHMWGAEDAYVEGMCGTVPIEYAEQHMVTR